MSTAKSRDYLVWLRETITSLEEAGKANILADVQIDWPGVIEELYDAGDSFAVNAAKIVAEILLDRIREYTLDVVQVNETCFKQIEEMLEKAPSLKDYLNEQIPEIYAFIVDRAKEESPSVFEFSQECPVKDIYEIVYRPNFAKIAPKIFVKATKND